MNKRIVLNPDSVSLHITEDGTVKSVGILVTPDEFDLIQNMTNNGMNKMRSDKRWGVLSNKDILINGDWK